MMEASAAEWLLQFFLSHAPALSIAVGMMPAYMPPMYM